MSREILFLFTFISFDNFESCDRAIASMDKQFIGQQAISVNFAMKKDGKGERHGTETERENQEK